MPFLAVESVDKLFRHRPRLGNFIGKERAGFTQALRQVSLSADEGEILVLLGPNGSGKSTLLKVIAGLLFPDAGQVLVAGAPVHENLRGMRRRIGMAISAEKSFYPRLTARENLEFFAVLEDVSPAQARERIPQLLEETGLSAAQDTLVMKFSTGMYQKLGIARAMIKRPELLLLDEPSRSLAPEAVEAFHSQLRALKNKRTTVVLATHSFEEAVEMGDSIAVLSAGTVAGRTGSQRIDQKQLASLYFSSIKQSPQVVQ
jgi:ABC-2 type transport system ATP-binding protein